MSKLATGIIESKNIIVCKDSKVADFKNNPRFRVFENEDYAKVRTLDVVTLQGCEFYIEITFFDNQVRKVNLRPSVKNYNIPTFPTEEYEAKKYAISKAFLFHELGQPSTVKEDSISYDFDWGNICSFLMREGKEPYVGGYIRIYYKQ